MRIEDRVRLRYFNWMYDLVCKDRFADSISYEMLFMFLHDTEFVWSIPHDENRAADGISLRYHYCQTYDCEDLEYCLDGPCSVLEMMIALAIRCEGITDDPEKGDRTAQWFWGMITSLGLGSMSDANYNEWLVNDVITRFLNREYDPDGRGGLFTVRHWDRDMRTAEIWHQLMAYINSVL